MHRRIPVALTAFLTALAIIDDLGVILVIAVFYTKPINLPFLVAAVLLFLLLIILNTAGMRRPGVYFLVGGLVWLAMLGSGVHATVAGILVALTVPARPRRSPGWFVRRTHRLANEFETLERESDRPLLGEEEQHAVAGSLQDTVEKATTPLRRWERYLERPIALVVMPVFALANAGIPIDVQALPGLWSDRLTLGIVIGLLLGKVSGITLMTWLSVRLGLGQLSTGVQIAISWESDCWEAWASRCRSLSPVWGSRHSPKHSSREKRPFCSPPCLPVFRDFSGCAFKGGQRIRETRPAKRRNNRNHGFFRCAMHWRCTARGPVQGTALTMTAICAGTGIYFNDSASISR